MSLHTRSTYVPPTKSTVQPPKPSLPQQHHQQSTATNLPQPSTAAPEVCTIAPQQQPVDTSPEECDIVPPPKQADTAPQSANATEPPATGSSTMLFNTGRQSNANHQPQPQQSNQQEMSTDEFLAMLQQGGKGPTQPPAPAPAPVPPVEHQCTPKMGNNQLLQILDASQLNPQSQSQSHSESQPQSEDNQMAPPPAEESSCSSSDGNQQPQPSQKLTQQTAASQRQEQVPLINRTPALQRQAQPQITATTSASQREPQAQLTANTPLLQTVTPRAPSQNLDRNAVTHSVTKANSKKNPYADKQHKQDTRRVSFSQASLPHRNTATTPSSVPTDAAACRLGC